MNYQLALEACRAYKACHVRLRQLGLNKEADKMQQEEQIWRRKYERLADDEAQRGTEYADMKEG